VKTNLRAHSSEIEQSKCLLKATSDSFDFHGEWCVLLGERLDPATSYGRVRAWDFRENLPGHSWLAAVILFAQLVHHGSVM
jgi:hypothetical protein